MAKRDPTRQGQPAEDRRQRYYELRRDGVRMTEAGREVGTTNMAVIKRYERWFQATESGQLGGPGD